MLITPLLVLLSLGSALGSPASSTPFSAKYIPLPSLREQDALEREWVQKRWDHIPHILAKQCVSRSPDRVRRFHDSAVAASCIHGWSVSWPVAGVAAVSDHWSCRRRAVHQPRHGETTTQPMPFACRDSDRTSVHSLVVKLRRAGRRPTAPSCRSCRSRTN